MATIHETPHRFIHARDAGVALVIAVTAAVAWFTTRGTLDHIAVDAKRIQAYTAGGRELWSHQVPGRELSLSATDGRSTYIDDLDGDGRREALVSVNIQGTAPAGVESRLLCFSASGTLRWSLALDDQLDFGSRRFGPPWTGMDVMAYGKERKTIVFAARHHASGPSLLVTLDADGTRLGRFAHSGRLMRVDVTADRRHILAAGINDAYDAPAVTVLASTQVDGHSPGTPGDQLDCSNCGQEPPERYFILQRADAGNAARPPLDRHVYSVVHTEDRIVVRMTDVEALTARPETVLELSPSFEVLRASRPVLAWSPQHGWREVRPPA